MKTEDLYFGEIRKLVATSGENPTRHLEFLMLKRLSDGCYREALSLFGKSYNTTYKNIGDIFVNPDPEILIPYHNALGQDKIARDKSRTELRKELEKLKEKILDEEKLLNTSAIFIGHLAQVSSFVPGDTGMFNAKIFKQVALLVENSYQYTDLKDGQTYCSFAGSIGDVYVPITNPNLLVPLNNFLTEDERNTQMTKKKILSRCDEIIKGKRG